MCVRVRHRAASVVSAAVVHDRALLVRWCDHRGSVRGHRITFACVKAADAFLAVALRVATTPIKTELATRAARAPAREKLTGVAARG